MVTLTIDDEGPGFVFGNCQWGIVDLRPENM